MTSAASQHISAMLMICSLMYPLSCSLIPMPMQFLQHPSTEKFVSILKAQRFFAKVQTSKYFWICHPTYSCAHSQHTVQDRDGPAHAAQTQKLSFTTSFCSTMPYSEVFSLFYSNTCFLPSVVQRLLASTEPVHKSHVASDMQPMTILLRPYYRPICMQ